MALPRPGFAKPLLILLTLPLCLLVACGGDPDDTSILSNATVTPSRGATLVPTVTPTTPPTPRPTATLVPSPTPTATPIPPPTLAANDAIVIGGELRTRKD